MDIPFFLVFDYDHSGTTSFKMQSLKKKRRVSEGSLTAKVRLDMRRGESAQRPKVKEVLDDSYFSGNIDIESPEPAYEIPDLRCLILSCLHTDRFITPQKVSCTCFYSCDQNRPTDKKPCC